MVKCVALCRVESLTIDKRVQPQTQLEKLIAGIFSEADSHDECVIKCFESALGADLAQLQSAAHYFKIGDEIDAATKYQCPRSALQRASTAVRNTTHTKFTASNDV